MAEPASELPISLAVSERKANIFRKAKEEAEAVLQSAREHTDELMKDLEETTGGITAPNLFKAAKKEMKAALRKGRTRLLHKIEAGRKAKDGDSTDDVEESETSDDEEEGDGTMALESEPAGHGSVDPENEPQDSGDKRKQSDGAELGNGKSAETGDKKHQDQMESEKEEIKGINQHEKPAHNHEAAGTQHEKSDDQQETEAAAPAKKELGEKKSTPQPLQRKWGFMQCLGELLETACSPK